MSHCNHAPVRLDGPDGVSWTCAAPGGRPRCDYLVSIHPRGPIKDRGQIWLNFASSSSFTLTSRRLPYLLSLAPIDTAYPMRRQECFTLCFQPKLLGHHRPRRRTITSYPRSVIFLASLRTMNAMNGKKQARSRKRHFASQSVRGGERENIAGG